MEQNQNNSSKNTSIVEVLCVVSSSTDSVNRVSVPLIARLSLEEWRKVSPFYEKSGNIPDESDEDYWFDLLGEDKYNAFFGLLFEKISPKISEEVVSINSPLYRLSLFNLKFVSYNVCLVN